MVLLVGELLFGVTWRTFIPYSDNYGMVFVAGVLFLYVSDLPARVKVPAIALVGAVGSWVKITVLIAPLAVAVHALIVADWSATRRKSSLMVVGGALAAFALCMGALQLATDALRAHYGFVSDEALAFGIWHFFMMGQNFDYYGMVNSEDVAYTASFATYAERSSANLAEALRRIAERGLLGNIVFYLKKIDVAYLDGLFHNMQSFTSASAVEEVEGTLLGSLYLQDGDLYQIGASAAQVMWDGMLLLLAASAFLSKRGQRDAMPFWILILGVTLYVLLFEDRSKYLFMFAPGYLVAAGVGLALLLDAVRSRSGVLADPSDG